MASHILIMYRHWLSLAEHYYPMITQVRHCHIWYFILYMDLSASQFYENNKKDR